MIPRPQSPATQTATATPTPGATEPAAPEPIAAAPLTPTVGDAWSATPFAPTAAAEPPGTAPPVTKTPLPASRQLIADIEATWGIDVVTAGQNWGADEASQLRNLGALAAALNALPPNVVAAATHSAHGTLAVLSNNAGRTLAGWQPYGDRAANFYTTQDSDESGRFDTSQVVLQTGSTALTIAHELLHAYQMRDLPSGAYGQALLTAEMQSFMDATGWVQTVSDAELASAVHGAWDELAAMFRYEGPALSYVNGNGELIEAFAPNPVEAFAAVGAVIYLTPGGAPPADWAVYADWFAVNLG